MAKAKSKNQKSVVVSAMEILAAIWGLIHKAVVAQGGTLLDIYRLNEPAGQPVIEQIAALIVAASKKSVAVAQSVQQKLADLIRACKFTYVNEYIIEANFPRPDQVEMDLERYLVVHLGKRSSSEDVLTYMEQHDLRPANAWEFLLWLAANPRAGIDYWIICLGSRWAHPDGRVRVPGAHPGGGGRRLGLGWFAHVWYEYSRFLAVRKSPKPSVA